MKHKAVNGHNTATSYSPKHRSEVLLIHSIAEEAEDGMRLKLSDCIPSFLSFFIIWKTHWCENDRSSKMMGRIESMLNHLHLAYFGQISSDTAPWLAFNKNMVLAQHWDNIYQNAVYLQLCYIYLNTHPTENLVKSYWHWDVHSILKGCKTAAALYSQPTTKSWGHSCDGFNTACYVYVL